MLKTTYSIVMGIAVMLVVSSFITIPNEKPVNELMPGVVFEIEVKDHGSTPPKVEEMEVMVEGRNIAIPVSSQDGGQKEGKMIFRGDRGEKGEAIIVDDENKSYFVVDESMMNNMKSQLSDVEKMMQDAMKNLTDEQRKALAEASQHGAPTMPGMAKPKSKSVLKKTGDRGEKQGYPCVKYEVFQDKRKIREIWTTDWDNIDGGDEAMQAFKGMGDFFDAIMDGFSGMPGGGNQFGADNPFSEMNFENGFPVVVQNFGEDGGLEDESWLKRTRRQRIDPADFEPPSGYKRMSMGPR